MNRYKFEIREGGSAMDAKTYLMQIMNIDQQINAKLEQLTRLKALATHIRHQRFLTCRRATIVTPDWRIRC